MILKNANVLDDIKTYEDLFFDIIYSDPPYNLSSEWFIDKDGSYQMKGMSKDFLNKWKGLTGENIDTLFKEGYRTLKHGGYMVMYSIDRQVGPFNYYAVKNGFEVCQSLYWFFMSNFPKASDVSKMVDKRFNTITKGKEIILPYADPENSSPSDIKNNTWNDGRKKSSMNAIYNETISTHPIAKKYDGYKYSIAPLKQCLETIMVFHKPLKNKSYIDDIIECETNSEIHSSCLNIDGERVEWSNENEKEKGRLGENANSMFGSNVGRNAGEFPSNDNGRFPSQLLVDEGAAEIIDNQTGIKTTSKSETFTTNPNNEIKLNGSKEIRHTNIGDTGGGSKILHTCKYETNEMDLLKYQPKVSKSERDGGLKGFELKESVGQEIVRKGGTAASGNHNPKCLKCGGEKISRTVGGNTKCNCEEPEWKECKNEAVKNPHPTVKPISLNKHILNLFKTPNHTRIYIPFSGSGSEVIAAIQVGYDEVYACEIAEEYSKIAEARIEHFCGHKNEIKGLVKNNIKNVATENIDDFWLK